MQDEVLTREKFAQWRENEWVPHANREDEYEKKVDRLWWTSVTALGMGGLILSIFMWVLLQKDAQLAALQTETHRIAVSQAAVIETVRNAQHELNRQGVAQAAITQTMIELIKQQSALQARSGG